MEKGSRVRIVRGHKGNGETGVVFWKGPNKWGEGERLGVRSDSGDTFWVSDQDVEATSEPAPAMEEGPTFNKGDRVSFKSQGREGTGTVFWIGESRQGAGQRLGVRDDAPEGEEDAVWLEARQALLLDGDAPTRQHPRPSGSDSHADEGYDAAPAVPSLDMPPLEDGPPVDDAWIDGQAADEE